MAQLWLFALALNLWAGSALGKQSQNLADSGTGVRNLLESVQPLTTLDYHGSDLDIYEHPDNSLDLKIHPHNKFLVTPLVEVDTASASLALRHSWLAASFRLDFTVVLWSEELRAAAVGFLEQQYGTTGEEVHLSPSQIQMIPLAAARLVWNSARPLPRGIRLSRDWVPLARRNPHQLRFSFLCDEQDVCAKLKTEMQQHPEEFRALNLEFTTSEKSSVTREIALSGQTLHSSPAFQQLQQSSSSGEGEEGVRFLTAADLESFSWDLTHTWISTVAHNGHHVDVQQMLALADLIIHRIGQEVSTSFMNQESWDSVLWEPNFARPDLVLKTLNEFLTPRSKENSTGVLVIDETKFDALENNGAFVSDLTAAISFVTEQTSPSNVNCDSTERDQSFRIWNKGTSKCKSILSAESSRPESMFRPGTNGLKTTMAQAGLSHWQVPIETFNRYLAAHSSYLHHNGRAFALKPMVLFRLDLSELVSEPELLRTEVQVHEQQKVHRIKVAFPVELVAPYQNEIELLSQSVRNLTENLTEVTTQLRSDLEQQMDQLRQKHSEDMRSLKDTHKFEVNTVRKEQQERVSAVKQQCEDTARAYRREFLDEAKTMRRLNTNLENVTHALVSKFSTFRINQEATAASLSAEIHQLEEIQDSLVHNISNEIMRVRNATFSLHDQDASVYFLATAGLTRTVNSGNAAVFDKVELTSRDRSYNPRTGTFVAPTSGLYLFYFSLYLKGNGIEVRVCRDQDVVFKGRDSTATAYQLPTGTFSLSLQRGQSVYIKFSYQTKVYGDINNWFGGHLIKQF